MVVRLYCIKYKDLDKDLFLYKKLAKESCKNLNSFVRISTCERIEIYSDKPLNSIDGMDNLEYPQSMQHAIEVCAGLDSGLFGEIEILDQIKNSVATAKKEEHLSKELGDLFFKIFKISKEVRKRYLLNESWVNAVKQKIRNKKRVFIYGGGGLSKKLRKSLKGKFDLVKDKENAEALVILKKGFVPLNNEKVIIINLTDKKIKKDEYTTKDFFTKPKEEIVKEIRREIKEILNY
ncbi:hypothetical protein J4402_01555 [Candidatus Pacearchaeota archaeon]|nr:hypothetical protein [Candidatus Pacearchaeota archaeon]